MKLRKQVSKINPAGFFFLICYFSPKKCLGSGCFSRVAAMKARSRYLKVIVMYPKHSRVLQLKRRRYSKSADDLEVIEIRLSVSLSPLLLTPQGWYHFVFNVKFTVLKIVKYASGMSTTMPTDDSRNACIEQTWSKLDWVYKYGRRNGKGVSVLGIGPLSMRIETR